MHRIITLLHCNYHLTGLVCQGSTETDIRIGIGRRIIEIERKRPGIRSIVLGATPIERHDRRRTRRKVRIQDADICCTANTRVQYISV